MPPTPRCSAARVHSDFTPAVFNGAREAGLLLMQCACCRCCCCSGGSGGSGGVGGGGVGGGGGGGRKSCGPVKQSGAGERVERQRL